jgi:hypothetical protein
MRTPLSDDDQTYSDNVIGNPDPWRFGRKTTLNRLENTKDYKNLQSEWKTMPQRIDNN